MRGAEGLDQIGDPGDLRHAAGDAHLAGLPWRRPQRAWWSTGHGHSALSGAYRGNQCATNIEERVRLIKHWPPVPPGGPDGPNAVRSGTNEFAPVRDGGAHRWYRGRRPIAVARVPTGSGLSRSQGPYFAIEGGSERDHTTAATRGR